MSIDNEYICLNDKYSQFYIFIVNFKNHYKISMNLYIILY
jgi:hypothetical protein